MAINILITKQSPGMGRYAALIKKVSTQTLKRVKHYLPVEDIDIVIYRSRMDAIPHLGIGAVTKNPNLIFVAIDPEFPKLTQSLPLNFTRSLTHELHHAAWYKKFSYPQTLLQDLVIEGLADHFDMEVNGVGPEKWDHALKLSEKKRMMQRLKKILYRKRSWEEYAAWFYGSEKLKIPKWTGYTIGFNLIRQYLADQSR